MGLYAECRDFFWTLELWPMGGCRHIPLLIWAASCSCIIARECHSLQQPCRGLHAPHDPGADPAGPPVDPGPVHRQAASKRRTPHKPCFVSPVLTHHVTPDDIILFRLSFVSLPLLLSLAFPYCCYLLIFFLFLFLPLVVFPHSLRPLTGARECVRAKLAYMHSQKWASGRL